MMADFESLLDHHTANGHDISCFCDLCSSRECEMKWITCTCKRCDPFHEAYYAIEEISDRCGNVYPHHPDGNSYDHWTECKCIPCGGSSGWRCTCPLCNKVEDAPITTHSDDDEKSIMNDRYIHFYNGHWVNCKCTRCAPGSVYNPNTIDFCTCPLCTKKRAVDKSEEIIIKRIDTTTRFIEIQRDASGYLSVSASCKKDLFTGETIWVLDLKEAEEELLRFKAEDIQIEPMPPKIEIDIKQECEDDSGIEGPPQHFERVDTLTHFIIKECGGYHLYSITATKHGQEECDEGEIADSPEAADSVFKYYIEKYS